MKGLKMKNVLICVVFVLALSGCTNNRIMHFNLDQNQENVSSHKGKAKFYFWGKWQRKDFDLSNICAKGRVVAVETHVSFWDSVLNMITGGVYFTESYAIYCGTSKNLSDKK